MSRIQKQVSNHIKKSLQAFTVENGLYKLGFRFFRRRNLSGSVLWNNSGSWFACQRLMKRFKRRKNIILRRITSGFIRFSSFYVLLKPNLSEGNFFNIYSMTPVIYMHELYNAYVLINTHLRYLSSFFYNNSTTLNLNGLFRFFRFTYPSIPKYYLMLILWQSYSKIFWSHELIKNNFALLYPLLEHIKINLLSNNLNYSMVTAALPVLIPWRATKRILKNAPKSKLTFFVKSAEVILNKFPTIY